MEKITVILPAYNAEKYIARAIDSILVQTHTNFELLIINDGSTDGTVSKIEQFNDHRIRLVSLDENRGLTHALNLGLSMAKGDYIARMDADDISLPSRFEKQVKFLKNNPDYVACGTSIINFNDRHESYMRYPQTDEQIRVSLAFFERNICHPTVMICRYAIEKYEIRYRREYAHAEDYSLWIDLSRIGKLYNTPEALLKYNRHSEQISSKYYSEQIKTSKDIVREQLKKAWPEVEEEELNGVLQLCVHQIGTAPNKHYSLKEIRRTIKLVEAYNAKHATFCDKNLRQLLAFKRFRCSFYYQYRFNYILNVITLAQHLLVEPSQFKSQLSDMFGLVKLKLTKFKMQQEIN
ncbi:glycosyltransferase family 2 protein [Vibrio astriarenae]|uniref:glycosyltransferase family 2 protein n=1 Tax=Vibrio astriarenae TaxID=1481923 RepID=UPI0037352185